MQQQRNYPLRNPGVAAVLSFLITGLGQVYNGEIAKGFAFMVIQIFNVVIMFIVLESVAIGSVTTIVLWIFTIVDAYQSAIKLNSERMSSSPSVEILTSKGIEMTPKQKRLWLIGIIVFATLIFTHWYTTR